MDAFSSLPDALLSTIHNRVHETGSLHDALALEATSKQLSTWFRGTTRFQQDVAVDGTCLTRDSSASSFWRWVAAHGRRMDSLTFHALDCNEALPALSTQAGVADALAVSVSFGRVTTLEPLAALPNLRHLQCSCLAAPAVPDPTAPTCPQALGQLTTLESLAVGHQFGEESAVISLACIAALTHLTRLELVRMHSLASLDFLPSLRPSLRSLTLCDLPSARPTLQPLSSLTGLTCLSLDRLPGACSDLAPLAALRGLQRLRLAQMPHGAGPPLDLRPLGRLAALRSLKLDGCMIASAAPVAALAPRLVELETSILLLSIAESEELEATVQRMRALTRLELSHRPPYGAHSAGAFLRPLTSLQQLELHDAMGSIEPVGELGALRVLRVYGSRAVASLAPLGRLGALRQLHLVSFESVSSLQPLSCLRGLQELSLMYLPCVSDLAPLGALAHLHSLHLAGCPLVGQAVVSTLRAALPALTVA